MTTAFIDLQDFIEEAVDFARDSGGREYDAHMMSDPDYAAYCNESLKLAYGLKPEDPLPMCHQLTGATTMQHECRVKGHQQLVSCGYAGPDSGCDDHECLHCGQYFSVPLY